jgi:hypothetical protein
MPYYIYRVKPFAQLEKLAAFDAFAEASAQAKALRAAQSAETPGKIKVMFAEDELQRRGPAVPGAGCATEGG